MSAPLVSVVLPTRDRQTSLGRAMRSVLEQSYDHLELIVVDDASSDATADVVLGFADPRISFVQLPKHRGANHARNRGIEMAQGPFIAFQDSDDEWLPNKLERQLAAFSAAPEAGLVYCKYRRLPAADGAPERVFGQPFNRTTLLSRNFIGTPTMVVKRSLLHAHPFDEDLPRRQDWELCLRLMQVCPFHFVDEILVIAHRSEGGVSSDPQRLLDAYRRILDRHGETIRRSRRAFAELHSTIGVLEASLGDLTGARRNLLRSLWTWPLAARHWVRAAAAWAYPAFFHGQNRP